MTIGALLDRGGDYSHLEKELTKLHVEEEYTIKLSTANKNGITATKFDVMLTNEEAIHHHRVHDDSHHEKNDYHDKSI